MWHTDISFELIAGHNAKFVSFSQRRFLGFRNRFEFDKKRVLISSNSELTIIGYDYMDRPFELYKGALNTSISNSLEQKENSPFTLREKEEVLLVQFLEDHIPNFVLVVAQDKSIDKVEFRIMKLSKVSKKNKQNQENGLQQLPSNKVFEQSTKDYIAEHLKEHIQNGNFNQRKKRENDNIEMTPKDNIQLFNSNKKARGSIQTQKSSNLTQNAIQTNELDFLSQEVVNPQTNKHKNRNSEQLSQSSSREYNAQDQPPSNSKSLNQLKQIEEQFLEESQLQNEENQKQPLTIDEFGKLQMNGCISKAYLFHAYNGNYLFALDQRNQTVSIYIIKSCVQSTTRNANSDPTCKMKMPKITNFRMAKRCILNLEYQPKDLDNYADYFLLSYVDPISFVDIYEKNGAFYDRIDIGKELEQSSELQLIGIQKVMFPRMRWSDRKIEEVERLSKLSLLKKFLIIGECRQNYKNERSSFKRDDNIDNENSGFQIKPFILLYNIQTKQCDKLKLLNIRGNSITAINYGPFDNGYLLLGLSNGVLLAIDLHEMEVIMSAQLFDNVGIREITFEPTNMVFVTSKKKEMIALNLVKRETHYVYLELGKKQYCTIAYNNQSVNQQTGNQKSQKSQDQADQQDDENTYRGNQNDHPLRFCC